jgi:hypothetical protein
MAIASSTLAGTDSSAASLSISMFGHRAVNVFLQGGVCLVFSLTWLPRITPPELRCLPEACCHVSNSSKP